MTFELRTLGTASAMPISDRNPSAQVLNVQGRLFLIDCGEGTQQQIRRAHLSFLRIEAIFISHLHGDHVFGLFGLLSTMSMYGRTGRLDIYGPGGISSIVEFYGRNFGDYLQYEVCCHELACESPEQIHESKHVRVSAFPLQHKMPCFGFRFDEIVTERHRQENPGYEPRSYAYCSDTRPFPELAGWVKGVTMLYHEATYQDEMADKAFERFHSTTSQAAACARDAGAGHLVVGHYSSRITDFDAFLAECRAVFPETQAAGDLDSFVF